MKFSENWLRQHVPTDAARERLAEVLTAIGLEVEDVSVLGEALDGVVVARIVSADRHPEADRLQVCQVDAGQDGLLQIVCGAPNARAGLVAPLATIGTKVGELTIKAAKLRGVESNGMLCSAKELGIDADASGLLELPDDAPVGTPLAEYLGLPTPASRSSSRPTAPTASACAASPSMSPRRSAAKSPRSMRSRCRPRPTRCCRSCSEPARTRRAISAA